MKTNQPDDEDFVPAEVTEMIIAAIHDEAEADDFDEEIEPLSAADEQAGEVAWDTYKHASSGRDIE